MKKNFVLQKQWLVIMILFLISHMYIVQYVRIKRILYYIDTSSTLLIN